MTRILAIASGKGGVGKTFLAATLGHAIARRGRRCLVFDADLGLANLDVQLGIDAPVDLGRVLEGRIPLERAVFRHEETGLDLVVGRSGSGTLAGLPPARLVALARELHALAPRYDVVLLDLAAGVEPPCRLFARASHGVIVITTEEPTALTDAYAFVKVACDRSRPVMVVANAVEDRVRGREVYETLARACERFLAFRPSYLGAVRRDPRVGEAIRAQKPLLVRHPTSPAAADVEDLAARLLAPAPRG